MSNEISAIVYDIEIRRCIPDTRNPAAASEINPVTGSPYEFCKGWTDYKGTGIGVLCAWDCATNRPLVYDQSTVGEFAELVKQRQVVTGFNIHKKSQRVRARQSQYKEARRWGRRAKDVSARRDAQVIHVLSG